MKNIPELLAARVARQPDKLFLFSESDGRRFSYRDFDEQVNLAACHLLSLGAGKGSTVSLYLPNCPEYLFCYFACWKIGARAGPINYELRHQEIEHIVENAESIILVTDLEGFPLLESVRTRVHGAWPIWVVDESPGDSIPATQGSDREAPFAGAADLEPDDDAMIIYTSGTTGRPKGCLLTHRNLLSNGRQIAEWLGFTSDDRLLCVMPLFHMNAVAVTTMAPLYAGASLVLARRFSASRFWNIISDYRVTSFGSVATMLSMLLGTCPAGVPTDCDVSSLRFAMCGSAPVPVEVIRRFEERFQCPVVEGYGLSESTCRSTFNPPDDRRRAGSVGLPIGNEMRVVDDDGCEVPVRARGEIVLRGENIMKGYFRNAEATDLAFRGGWFHTGDIGYRDEDGYYYVVDRKSDMIIRGGENIYPREIDEVLYRHPKIREAATVGVPDPLYGESVASFVALEPGHTCTEEEIVGHCRDVLAGYKCPAKVIFLKELPKGPTGKVLKRDLVARYPMNNS